MFFKYRCEMNFFRFILLCFWRIDVAVGAIKAENSFNISILKKPFQITQEEQELTSPIFLFLIFFRQ